MTRQQMVSQEDNPKRKLTRLGIGIIAILALLWRLIFWMWSILIVGIIVGVLGNAAFTLLTTGKIDITGTLAVVAWLNAHLALCLLLLSPILVLTLCSYLAYHRQQREAQEDQRIHDQSLVVVAQGVKRALDELNTKPAVSSILPSPADQETAPPNMVWNIPYRRNPFFTGREQLLTRLHDHLTSSKAAALTQAQAINGLGGIGKTQTAVEYAYRYKEEYRYLLWASAASRETLLLDYVALASVLDLPEKKEQDQNNAAAAVKRWLETHDQWLLILDNADELRVINNFLPTGSNGSLLITTRTQATGSIARSIEVREIDTEEGTLLLLRRAGVLELGAPLAQAPQQDRAKAQAIVRLMDGLPLALDQAGAYIEETQCSAASYAEQYQRRQLDLLKRRGETALDHREPVATTWSLSFEKVEHLNPTAADLLRFCAFISADDIPIEMVAAGAAQLGTLLQPIATDPSLLDEPIALLRRYSLVRRNTHENTLSIHRLVQTVLKASMNDETQRQWAQRTVRAVNKAFPQVEVDTWPQCKRYLPHAQVCADLIHHYALAFPEATRLLNQAGYYVYVHALYEQAEPLSQRALAIYEQMLGATHPDTASSLNNLAGLYYTQGQYEQAEPLSQRALAIYEQMLGPDHPSTRVIRNNYAVLRDTKQGGKGNRRAESASTSNDKHTRQQDRRHL